MPLLAAHDELLGLLAKQAPELDRGLEAATRAILSGDIDAERAAMQRVGETVAATQGLSDLLGRRRVLLEHDHFHNRPSSRKPHSAAYAVTSVYSPVVPQVTFEEAVRDILTREPRLANGAAEVAQLYGERHAFAVAQSTDVVLTRRVQEAIARAIRDGVDVRRDAHVLAEMAGWRDSYARNVFRTNVAEAYSQGRILQARDPDVSDVIVGMRFVTSLPDPDVRPNHARGHGYAAPVDWPGWQTRRSPLGYQCRCGMELVDRFRAQREGLLAMGRLIMKPVPSGWHPDEGFRRAA